jgi:hypothetical protein
MTQQCLLQPACKNGISNFIVEKLISFGRLDAVGCHYITLDVRSIVT